MFINRSLPILQLHPSLPDQLVSTPAILAKHCSLQLQLTLETPASTCSTIQTLSYSQEMVEEASKETEMSLMKDEASVQDLEGRSWTTKEQVIQKLFGEKQYKYRLKLRNKFPSTIYKERNIGLNVELIDA